MSSRILIVEDEMYLAMMLEDVLVAGGYLVVCAARVEDAIRVIEGGESIAAALLDVNVNGEQVYPVARLLQERSVPFLFASAYGAAGISDEYRTFPVMGKPYPVTDVVPSIERLIATAAR